MPASAVSLGSRIRAARLRQDLSLRETAAKAGITPSALSQLERDHFNPTLGTLKALAEALGITIGSLFTPSSAPGRVVVRPAERKRLSPRHGITYHLLTPDLSGQIAFLLSVYAPRASSGAEPFAYHAAQSGLVFQGVAEIHLGDVFYRLEAGDRTRCHRAIPRRIG